MIRRLLRQSPVEISFSFRNKIRQNVEVSNVVAELPGRSEQSHSWVLVGGHLDSWHPGTGAQDNGTGVASVIETARSIVASGHSPLKTLRFVLFGGEEEGLLGSRAYVRAHASELADCDAAIVTDIGSGAPKGWYTFGRADVRQALSALEPLLSGIGGSRTNDENDNFFNSDHTPFLLAGVPVLFLWPEQAEYSIVHHLPADTFDKVNERNLNEDTAVVAATAYAIANSPTPFAPHLTSKQVENQLETEKVYFQYLDLMKHLMF
jgi:Zn-dependent M28 family amino/carboxypeptidase